MRFASAQLVQIFLLSEHCAWAIGRKYVSGPLVVKELGGIDVHVDMAANRQVAELILHERNSGKAPERR